MRQHFHQSPVKRPEGELDEEAPSQGHGSLPGNRLGLGFQGVHGCHHQSQACGGHSECVSGDDWVSSGFEYCLSLTGVIYMLKVGTLISIISSISESIFKILVPIM